MERPSGAQKRVAHLVYASDIFHVASLYIYYKVKRNSKHLMYIHRHEKEKMQPCRRTGNHINLKEALRGQHI